MITLRPFEQERFNRLVELAQSRFDAALTQPEARVLMHSAAAYHLPEPSETELRPPVRSELLRWLMTDPDAAKFIDPKGVRIWSVSIPTPLDLAFSLELVRDFVAEKAADLRAAFDEETAKARQFLAQHIQKLVLTPRETETGPVYDVSRDIDLFGGDGKAMSLAVEVIAGRSAKGKKDVMHNGGQGRN